MYIKQFVLYSPFSSVKTATLPRLITQNYKIIFQPHLPATERANISASQATMEKSIPDPRPAKLRHTFHTLGIASLKAPWHQATPAKKKLMETINDWHNQSPEPITFVGSEDEAFHRQRENCEIQICTWSLQKPSFTLHIQQLHLKPFAKLFFQAGIMVAQKYVSIWAT